MIHSVVYTSMHNFLEDIGLLILQLRKVNKNNTTIHTKKKIHTRINVCRHTRVAWNNQKNARNKQTNIVGLFICLPWFCFYCYCILLFYSLLLFYVVYKHTHAQLVLCFNEKFLQAWHLASVFHLFVCLNSWRLQRAC